MKKALIVFLVLLVIIGPSNKVSAAKTTTQLQENEVDTARTTITQRQEQEKQYRTNIKNILDADRAREFGIKEAEVLSIKDSKEEVDTSVDTTKNVYKFDEIKLVGNKIYSYKRLKKAVLNKFLDKHINKSNIKSLQRMLSDYYIDRGYSMVKVYFNPKQMITIIDNKETKEQRTIFTFIIEENKVGKILLEQNRKNSESKSTSKICNFTRQMQLFFAFPFRKNKPFDLKAFEQGLDQMNRLQSNKVTMEVSPAADKSLVSPNSDIIVKNNQNPADGGACAGSRTTFLNLNYNNSGSKATGENVINLNISQDNLLSINDNIYVSYTESKDSVFGEDKKWSNIFHRHKTLDLFDNDHKKKKFSKALYGNISFPFGYWTFNTSINCSTYKNTVEALNNTFPVTGKTVSQEYGIDRVALRTRRYKLNLGGGLGISDSESYIRDAKSMTGSAKRTNGSIYLNNTIYTKNGTFIIKPKYQQGLDWFGAKKDEKTYKGNMTESDAKRQYKLASLFLYFNTKVNMPLLTRDKESKQRNKLPLTYTLAVNSQYSFDSLYGTEEFSIGGEHTVRGYKDSIISGDNGVSIRNDLKVNVLELMPDVLIKEKWVKHKTALLFGESISTIFSKTQLCGFCDIGCIGKHKENVRNGKYMTGCGLSLSYSGKYINSTLTYSKGLHCPNRDGLEREKQAIYWKIGASW